MPYAIRDMAYGIRHMAIEIYGRLLLGRRGSGMGLVVFVHEILGDLHGRRIPDQNIAALGDLAFQHHNDIALLAILIEELVDTGPYRRNHFLTSFLEQELIVFSLSLEGLLQLRALFHPTVEY